ncbi:hypothetical protein Bbelb_373040 [Branchiostoma belcheri]|nr:hypothetical protein Bbelb_373040 [Branchiostoma belcheri]
MSHQRSAAQHGVCLTRDQYTGTADLKIRLHIGTEAMSSREKRRSRPLASPRQDLILELQQLQQLRVAVDSRCLSAQKRSQAVKKKRRSRPPASPKQDLILELQELQQLRVAVDCRCLSAQKRSLAVKKTDPPASLAKTRPDTPTTATTVTTHTTTGTTATTRSKKAQTQMPIGKEAISGRKKRRSRRLVSPREDLIPQLQELQRWTLSTYRHESEVRPSKKTVPPASFAKSRRIMPTTHLHQLHAVRRPLGVDSTCVNQHSATPVQHLSVSRLCVYRKFVMRNRSQKNIPHARPPFCRVVSTLAPHIPGTSAVDFVMAYMNAPPKKDVSPRQDLILQLQQLQELRVAVDCRCLSAQKRSLAVKKTDPPASLAKTRPDTPTTATTGTTATTRKASRPLASPRQDLIPQLQELQKLRVVRSLSYNIPFLNAVGCRCLSARKQSLAVKKTVPPASLAKKGPDTPTTATTATTRKAISGREKRRSRPLASPRQDLIPQLQQLQELQKLRVVRSLSNNIPFLNEVDSGAYRHRSDVKPLKKTVPPASLAKTRPDTPTTATTAATRSKKAF